MVNFTSSASLSLLTQFVEEGEIELAPVCSQGRKTRLLVGCASKWLLSSKLKKNLVNNALFYLGKMAVLVLDI